MLVVDLACPLGHCFEGWFASADDLASQQARGLVACPVCGDVHVERRPSATRLNVSGALAPPVVDTAPHVAGASGAPPAAAPADQVGWHEAMVQAQQWLAKAAAHVVANTEDVGERFADEARAIHHGDAPERGIRGQATQAQQQALAEEGIEVMSLPWPVANKGTLQ
jgi:hypothetical protein